MKIQSIVALLALLLTTGCKTSPPRAENAPGFVRFDHTYNTVHDMKFETQMKAAGFTFGERKVEHPGSLLCHFVTIGKPVQSDVVPYLEFCLIRDKKAYLEAEQSDKDFDVKNKKMSEARLQLKGINFGYTGGFQSYVAELKKTHPNINAIYSHKNFDWQNNSKDHLPGWNFIEFLKRPLQMDVSVSFIGYDPRPHLAEKLSTPGIHANGANRIAGLVMDLATPAEVDFVQAITLKNFTEGRILLGDEFQIANFSQLNAEEKKLFAKSPASYKAVLVEADPDKLDAIKLPYERILYRGQKVKKVKLANFSWDIVLIRGSLAK